jgi:outer membrane protein, heavy metal efflux system
MKQKICWLVFSVIFASSSHNLVMAGQSLAVAPETSITATNQVLLNTVVGEVLEHNPELNFYRAQIGIAKGEHQTFGTWSNPELSASAGSKRVTSGSLSEEGLAWSVAVKQTFEWPGRIPLRKAIANRDIELAELGFNQFKNALTARTYVLVYTLFAAQEKAIAAREVAERYQALREVLVQRDSAGLTPALEIRIIEATELSLQRKATEARLAEQSALLELNQLRGHPLEESLRIAPPQISFTPAPELGILLAKAQTNNFEIRMRQVELEQQGFRVSLARNERYPAFSVEPYYSDERAIDQEKRFGVGISVPLPLWNRNSGKIASEKARQEQAATSLALVQRNVGRQVTEKALAYRTKLEEMGRWRPDSVQQFKSAAELADRHYRLGAVPMTVYIELQKQYLEAVEALLDTKKEALEAGQELQTLTGWDSNLTTSGAAPTTEKSQATSKP